MPNERILLHICCAPCATTVVRRLQEAGYDVHGYFYNPNIQPEKEYYQRLLEAQRLCKLWSIPLEIGEYDWDRWQAEIRGLEDEPEGGKRCQACYRWRLAAVAQKARDLEIGIIATTLTISPRKRPEVINPIGKGICAELELRFYEADWKKKDGYKQSVDTSKELHIYRQHYCGCKYSLREREQRLTRDAGRQTLDARRSTPEDSSGVVHPASCILPSIPAPGNKHPESSIEHTLPDTRAKWELTPLERKKRRDKKGKPWQRK